uniref:Uncharacterized protein n=1 Tax=Biomphalaria glabrata TaxID=6526 RepID=A0A2C9M0U8_BIOGL
MPTTIKKTRKLLFHSSNHECQESQGGEAELHKHLENCSKNPGHVQFIPVEEFAWKHLPKGHRGQALYDLIKTTADLTVRVAVGNTSLKRPDVWAETLSLYPFSDKRGHKNFRTGSGMIWYVDKFTDGTKQDGGKHWKKYKKCWCRNCQYSESPNNVWWDFKVYTATHVVFDEMEASHTYLRLFYDKNDSPEVIVDRVSVDYTHVEHDRCLLNCVTCDETVGQRLEVTWRRYRETWPKVRRIYRESKHGDRLTFIVSHPHGCSKQISVGQWKNKYQMGNRFKYKFTYTTCTCPGSSGAYVHCVGYNRWATQLAHSGTSTEGNFSGAGFIM